MRFSHQERFILPNINFYMKLFSSPNDFMCKFAALFANAKQKNYKQVIQSANTIISNKKHTSTANCR